MKDDYLWDPSGPPDPEVQRLERLLGRLRTTAPVPTVAQRHDNADRRAATLSGLCSTFSGKPSCTRTPRFLVPALAAAAAIVMMVGDVSWQSAQRLRRGRSRASTVSRASARRRCPAQAACPSVRRSAPTLFARARRSRQHRPGDGRHRHARAAGRDARHASSARARTRHPARVHRRAARPVHRRHAVGDGDRSWLRLRPVRGRGRVGSADRRRRLGGVRRQGTRVVRPRRRVGAHRPVERSRHAAVQRCGPAFREALDEIDYGRIWREQGQSASRRPRARATARCDDAVAPDRPGRACRSRGRRRRLAALVAMPASVTRDAVMRLDRPRWTSGGTALGLRDTGWWRTWNETTQSIVGELVSW